MSIGERVREARVERKLTLSALAGRSKLSKGFISQVENGFSNPSVESLRRIAAALSVPAAQLIEDVTPVACAEPMDAPFLVRYSAAATGRSHLANLSSTTAGEFARISLLPGSFLKGADRTGAAVTCFCTVLGGNVQFSSKGKTLDLSGGDALTWNVGETYKLANVGGGVALLLLFVSANGILPAISRSAYSEATPHTAHPQLPGEARGPLKLVAMRAARTRVRTP